MVQGVRTSKARQNRAGSFQPGILLELVVYQQPQKNMQRLREFQVAYIYSTLQENVVKNSIVLFSVELLLRLLPEHAPLPDLFNFVYEYFITLDKNPPHNVANFPLFFIIQCSRNLGYELKENYSKDTPHLNMQEGGFSNQSPVTPPFISEEDAIILNSLLKAGDFENLKQIEMNAGIRMRLMDWYIAFLKLHTQHMGNIRSLSILQAILH